MPVNPPPKYVHAYLELETKKRIYCWFNPTTFSHSRSSSWSGKARPAQAVPDLAYSGGESEQLNLSLLLQSDPQMKGRAGADVAKSITTLFSLLNPTVSVPDRDQQRPPWAKFVWGQYVSNESVVVSVSVVREYFDPDGAPLRAKVDLVLRQFRPGPNQGPPPSQNPTTRATHERRMHTVSPGDSLQSIAYHHLGDPTRWKEIATANGIDDPLRLEPGLALSIHTGAVPDLAANGHQPRR
jgi:Contractile injection system tube protein/LysM domain